MAVYGIMTVGGQNPQYILAYTVRGRSRVATYHVPVSFEPGLDAFSQDRAIREFIKSRHPRSKIVDYYLKWAQKP